ncbi:BTAD domain-containing putative transcriptional regulator [Streptomyces sp. RM72]|uniref:AfsR/SARP family transcriptional regulator n=1 Tax=Streptomyces sp. RM72 TaxID=1115510 RepID=UPI0027E3AFAB|nr:BTAD domain-containing putative transcriptional regulator [Streptomyces sp. RM72]
MRSTYEFGILGPLLVRQSGTPVHVNAAKLRMLLASLLVEADRVVTVDTLVHRLWGDTPPLRARNTLQNYVLRLRRALGSPADTGPVRTHPRGYLIETDPQTLDVRRFTSLVRLGRTALEQNAAERAAALLRQALELWRGDPLCDLPGDAFPELRLTLQEQHLAALELRIDADLAAGRSADVLPELRALVEAHPLREHFWTQRMLALYRCERQSEALECYRTVTALLGEELGVTPGPALRDMHARVLAAAPDLGRSPGRTEAASSPNAPGRHVLPVETTGFIGREAQLAQVRALLSTARLVTLTGVGGVGKTRLALRSAAQLAASYADGVHLADLAALTSPDLLDRAVAEALGLRDQSARPPAEAIVDRLRDRQLLLLLDNCEHVAGAVAALVLRLLRAAPGLTVLATSRHRLGVPGEHILTVPCLTLPEPGAACDARQPPERSESVRLLVQRAAASAPAFGITPRNRAAVAQLCRRLDGIPLAIELAAVRLGAMTAEEMLERLDDRFRVLCLPGMPGTETRYQHTLRGVIDWSHTLCTPQERLLWARLSVFSGGFDLSAAEAVCAGEGVGREEILDLLAALVDKSLVAVDSTGPRARYSMLETIRQYGLERLGELSRHTGLRIRHSAHYRAMTLRAGAEWCGPHEVDWLLRLREELPNLRTALDFCATRPEHVGTAVAIAVDLARTRCWFFSSVLGEGRYWLERLLASPPALPPDLTAGALAMKVWIALCQGDNPAAETFLAECRTQAAGSDGPAVAPFTFIEGAHALLVDGTSESIPRLAAAREQFLRDGRHGDAHMATMMWAMAEAFLGDPVSARAAAKEYTAEAEAGRAPWARTWACWCAGLVELRHGDPAASLAPLRDALARQSAFGDNWGPVWGVETLAWAVAETDRHTDAARLLGAAHRLRQDTGVALTGLRPFHDAHVAAERRVRTVLTAQEYAQARTYGAAENSVLFALRISAKPRTGAQAKTGATPPPRRHEQSPTGLAGPCVSSDTG